MKLLGTGSTRFMLQVTYPVTQFRKAQVRKLGPLASWTDGVRKTQWCWELINAKCRTTSYFRIKQELVAHVLRRGPGIPCEEVTESQQNALAVGNPTTHKDAWCKPQPKDHGSLLHEKSEAIPGVWCPVWGPCYKKEMDTLENPVPKGLDQVISEEEPHMSENHRIT